MTQTGISQTKRRRLRSAPREKPAVSCSPELQERIFSIAGKTVGEEILGQFAGGHLPTGGEAFAAFEESVLHVAEQLVVAPVLGALLQELHEQESFVAWAMRSAREKTPLEAKKDREVSVRVVGGGVVDLRTPYMRPPTPKGRPGRPRKPGRRGKQGSGLLALLGVLGFALRVSPRVASRVSRAAASADSFEEAREALAGQGLEMHVNTIRRITARFADAGLVEREQHGGGDPRALAGKRVVALLDGGRLRYRLEKTGRRRKNGRHGFDAPWREPKLLAIYTIDDKGKKTKDLPIYEGTLAPWEDAAAIASSVLIKYGAKDAKSLTIAADGSDNIWDQFETILAAIGIDRSKVTFFVDYYHATEHLHKASKLVSDGSDRQRKQWVNKQAKLLLRGRVEQAVLAIEKLKTTATEERDREAAYFRKRKDRMRYNELRDQNLPIGTGGVESAIRRVVNLRLKSTGIFWKPENAERILHLRCRLKAGRWKEAEAAYDRSALLPDIHQKPAILDRLLD